MCNRLWRISNRDDWVSFFILTLNWENFWDWENPRKFFTFRFEKRIAYIVRERGVNKDFLKIWDLMVKNIPECLGT